MIQRETCHSKAARALTDKGDNWPACRGRQPDDSSARATRELRQTKDVLTSGVGGWHRTGGGGGGGSEGGGGGMQDNATLSNKRMRDNRCHSHVTQWTLANAAGL